MQPSVDVRSQIFLESSGRVATAPWHAPGNVHILSWALNWAKGGTIESDISLVMLAIWLRQAGCSTLGIAGLLCRTAALRAASMCRGSLNDEDKLAWIEDQDRLIRFLSSVDSDDGEFRWLVPLPEPNIERIIRSYCRKGDVSPDHLDELEREVSALLPEIDRVEKEYLDAHPTAMPLMRNGDRCPTLFFQSKTSTRTIVRLLALMRGRVEEECDKAFPPDPRNNEVNLFLDLCRAALRHGYPRSADTVGFLDAATGLPGCFSGDTHHPLHVSLAAHARHNQPMRFNAGVDTNHCVELWLVNALRKTWRWSTLVHVLQSASPVLRPLLAVLVRRGVLPACDLPDELEPSSQLREMWGENALSWEEVVRQRPDLGAHVDELEQAFQAQGERRRAQATPAPSGAAACQSCGGCVSGERVACVSCSKHARLTRRHVSTRNQLHVAEFAVPEDDLMREHSSQRLPEPALPPPPLALERATLRTVDEFALGIAAPPLLPPPCLEPSPRGYRIGSYTDACDNCGDTEFLVNGGLCRACDDFEVKYGKPRPENRHGTHTGQCMVCKEHKRLVSRNRPCDDCYQDELSRFDRSKPQACAGCGRKDKVSKSTGRCLAFDGKGGFVSTQST